MNEALDLAEWRNDRSPGWYHDTGYAFQDVLRRHRYDYEDKGSKPDDPGWHTCSCGAWEGYWCEFYPHVADYLRAALSTTPLVVLTPEQVEQVKALAAAAHDLAYPLNRDQRAIVSAARNVLASLPAQLHPGSPQ